jgi:hypothetical protein
MKLKLKQMPHHKEEIASWVRKKTVQFNKKKDQIVNKNSIDHIKNVFEIQILTD